MEFPEKRIYENHKKIMSLRKLPHQRLINLGSPVKPKNLLGKKLDGTKRLRLQIQIEMLKFIGKSKVKHSGYAGASMTNMLMICFRKTRPTKRCGPI